MLAFVTLRTTFVTYSIFSTLFCAQKEGRSWRYHSIRGDKVFSEVILCSVDRRSSCQTRRKRHGLYFREEIRHYEGRWPLSPRLFLVWCSAGHKGSLVINAKSGHSVIFMATEGSVSCRTVAPLRKMSPPAAIFVSL